MSECSEMPDIRLSFGALINVKTDFDYGPRLTLLGIRFTAV